MSQSHSSNTHFSHLEHESLISISGADASKFLQGQVTCDVRTLTQTGSLGAHCTHKGRMLFSFFALASSPENIYLRLPAEQADTALAALNKYIVFSKAKTELQTGWKKIGVWGDNARDIVDTLTTQAPSQNNSFSLCEAHIIIQRSHNQFECWLHPDTPLCEEVFAQYSASQKNHSAWQLLDIQQGIGHIYAGNTEQLIPQMLNYQLLNGISFNKGCYTGQEVVARMQYHGKLKRHMYRMQIPSNCELPKPGAAIYSSASAQSVGSVVLACVPATETEQATAEALVVATDASVNANDCFLDLEHQQKLSQLELPYAINEE